MAKYSLTSPSTFKIRHRHLVVQDFLSLLADNIVILEVIYCASIMVLKSYQCCVCYHLCIRHTTESMLVLHIISESMFCYFYIKEKHFTHFLSIAAYYYHFLAIFSFFETIVDI